MRRLGIRLLGTSAALDELRQALAPYGHELAAQAPAIDLLIEDGSQPVVQDLASVAVMSLRLSIGAMSEWGLPVLQIRCYDRLQQLLAVLDIAPPSCGNGQQLRRQAIARLIEWVALQVSGFAQPWALCAARKRFPGSRAKPRGSGRAGLPASFQPNR